MSEGLQNMEIHDLPSKIYCKWMASLGRWGRIGVQGDGSCFFHSVCALRNESNYLFRTPSEQRDIAYSFRCSLKSQFTLEAYHSAGLHHPDKDTYEKKLNAFCTPKTWADEVMIRFASKMLNMNLIFIDMLNGQAYCGVHGIETLQNMHNLGRIDQNTGIVAWVEHRHFEPIIRIDSVNDTEGLITTLFNTKEDKETIFRIMSEYVDGCKI